MKAESDYKVAPMIVSDTGTLNQVEAATRTQRRVLQTRARLLRSALKLFCQKGVEATTIEDITEGADLGKGTFYRHFPTKEDAVSAIVQDAVGRLVERIRAKPTAQQSPSDVLADLVRAHVLHFQAGRAEFAVILQSRLMQKLEAEGAGLDEPLRGYLGELDRQMSAPAPGGMSRGKVRGLACALMAFVSLALSLTPAGMAEQQIEASIGPLRRAFVESCIAHLTTNRP